MTNMRLDDTASSGRDPERTRSAILDATLAAIAEHGEPGVRVARIAAAAGVTTGALYGHFQSRDGLIAAAQIHYLGLQYTHYMEAFDFAHAVNQEAAASGTADYANFIQDLFSDTGERARHMWAEAVDRSLTDEDLAADLRPIEFALVDRAREQIQSLQEAGLVAPELDPRAVAALRIAASLGAAFTAPIYADDPELKSKMIEAWPLLVRSFAPRPVQPDSESEGVE
jgi:AcrR family transcriptional regulator